MPKETIYPSNANATGYGRAENRLPHRGRVEVKWGQDEVSLAVAQYSTLLPEDTWEGVAVTLTRAEINALIVLLRRARDRAHGRDE